MDLENGMVKDNPNSIVQRIVTGICEECGELLYDDEYVIRFFGYQFHDNQECFDNFIDKNKEIE